MKITLEVKLEIGTKVYYIAQDESHPQAQCSAACGECGAKHFHYPPVKYKTYEGMVSSVIINGQGEHSGNVDLNKPYRLYYQLYSGWYANEDQLFLTQEEAEKCLDNKERRLN